MSGVDTTPDATAGAPSWRDALSEALAHPAIAGMPRLARHPDTVRHQLHTYCELLIEESRVFGLISAGDAADPRRLVIRHVVESLAAWQAIEQTAEPTIVDLGSGAGLPGIPLAIGLGGAVLLVERKEKRARFLELAVARLGLPNLTVHCGDALRLAAEWNGGALLDRCVVTYRAFLPTDRRLAAVLRRSFVPGTPVVAYKSRDLDEDVAALASLGVAQPETVEVRRMEAPMQEAQRTLLLFRTAHGLSRAG